MPELLGTHKKSQPINHNLPRNIVMTIVITFFWPIDEGDDKIRYIAKTTVLIDYLWLRSVSLFKNICFPSFFLIDYLWCYFQNECWFFFFQPLSRYPTLINHFYKALYWYNWLLCFLIFLKQVSKTYGNKIVVDTKFGRDFSIFLGLKEKWTDIYQW